nr:copia protein [Tanacetum cinerariifolium]
MHSESVHEHTNHVKLKTIINTSNDDKIDSIVIFDDPYVDNNGGTYEHDSNAYDQYVTLESPIQNVQNEAKNQHSLNNELKKQKALLQKKLETCKKRVKTLEKQPVKSLNYQEAYEEIRHETELSKKAFKERENKYLEEIVDLEDKRSSDDRNVYKTEQSIQTIHMLGKKPNKIVDSGCSKHMTGNLNLLRNFIEKFMGTVRFGNDNFAAITGYGDYVQGNRTICYMYYVEGLRHNLFLVGQFCDGDLEVAFRLNTCFIQNLEGEDLLTEYYATRTPEVSDNSTANTLDTKDTPSSSLVIVDDSGVPQIVTSSEELIAQESSNPVLDIHSDEQIQEDDAELDGNTIMHSFKTLAFEEAELSSNYQDPSNMHKFHQQHRYVDKWTKIHPIEQVIDDPSKPVTTRSRLQNNAEFCMYAFTAHPTDKHLKEVKRIFRYLRQPINIGLWYSKDYGFKLIAYSDVDHAGRHNDCKHTYGGIQFLRDKLVSWSSKKQDCTAMPTAEVDEIAISFNPVQHSRTKHINNRYHFIKEHVEQERITYIVDMFRDTLKLPVEIPDNLFTQQADLKFIQRFLKIVGYEGIVDKQKKDVIQYPRFTKLIIDDLMKKFPSISQRLEENYHSIKDDIPLVSVYTTGNVTVKGMLIPGEFLTGDIHATIEYKEYEKTPRATRIPTPNAEVVQKKRASKAVAGESSTPRKSLTVTTKKKKPSTTSIPPPSDDRERDEIHKATQLSIIMHKTAIIVEAQENVAKVQEKILKEDIKKMVEGEEDEESYASEFADSVFQDDDDDSGDRIEPESHKKNSEVVDDYDDINDNVDKEKKNDDVEEMKDNSSDDNDDHVDHTFIRREVSGSLETRNEHTQTPIPSPPRSPRTDLSLDKTLSEELTANVLPTPDTISKDPNTSQPTLSTSKILTGSVAELSRCHGQLREQLTNTFIIKEYFKGKIKEIFDTLNNLVPELTIKTNELMK